MYNSSNVPGKANLAIYQGDDYAATVTVTDGDTGQPADLTGYLAQAQIRAGYADSKPDVLVEIQTAIAGSTVALTIPAAETQTLAGNYLWDLQLISPAGTTTTILAGTVSAASEVTREVGVMARGS